MNTILALVAKDLRRRRASPATTLVTLSFPVIFALLIGLAFGGGGKGGASLPPIDILLADEDNSLVGRFLAGASGRTGAEMQIHFRNVDRAEGERLLGKGKASALLIIPAGFTDHLLAGQPDTLIVRKNPAESIAPMIAEEFVEASALILSNAGSVFGEEIAEIRTLMNAPEGPEDSAIASIAVAVNHAMQSVVPYVNPPLVKLETATAPDSAAGDKGSDEEGPMDIALFILPGISVMTLLMMGQSAMRDLLREKASGTLRRTFAAPVTVPTIIASKFITTAILAAIGLLILSVIGSLWGAPRADPAGFVVLSLAFIFAITGFTSLVYGFAKSERQGSTVGEILIMMMSFIGGSWIPLSSLSESLRRLAPFTFNYWAVDGYGRLLFDHAGLPALAKNIAVLALIGLIGATLGSALLRRRLMQGT